MTRVQKPSFGDMDHRDYSAKKKEEKRKKEKKNFF